MRFWVGNGQVSAHCVSITHTIVDCPILSCLRFSDLAPSKVVLACGFSVVARFLGAATFACVVRCDQVSVAPTVAASIGWCLMQLEGCTWGWLGYFLQ
jgi:hypothetical protein